MAVPPDLQQTPLHDVHRALGARMMAFGGFDMPVQYAGIIEEHMAVRQAAGLFDVSHMGEVEVRGPKAFDFVQRLVTNDAAKLDDGRAMYTVMCREDGGIVDDLLVYRRAEDRYLLVINAANVAKDVAWMRRVNEHVGADIRDRSADFALLAVQGPKAFEIVQTLTDVPLGGIGYYRFVEPPPETFLACREAILSHTGYTGETGLEIYCEADRARDVWDAVMEAGRAHGLKPAGLGARDTLRLEAGYALYGNDITDETNPIEAGLGWVVKLDKGDFVGRDAIARVKEQGPARKLIGFVVSDRGLPRPGYEITDSEGNPIGEVTSGSQSPVLGTGVGLGYVQNDPAFTAVGTPVGVRVRGRVLAAEVQKPPFHT